MKKRKASVALEKEVTTPLNLQKKKLHDSVLDISITSFDSISQNTIVTPFENLSQLIETNTKNSEITTVIFSNIDQKSENANELLKVYTKAMKEGGYSQVEVIKFLCKSKEILNDKVTTKIDDIDMEEEIFVDFFNIISTSNSSLKELSVPNFFYDKNDICTLHSKTIVKLKIYYNLKTNFFDFKELSSKLPNLKFLNWCDEEIDLDIIKNLMESLPFALTIAPNRIVVDKTGANKSESIKAKKHPDYKNLYAPLYLKKIPGCAFDLVKQAHAKEFITLFQCMNVGKTKSEKGLFKNLAKLIYKFNVQEYTQEYTDEFLKTDPVYQFYCNSNSETEKVAKEMIGDAMYECNI